MLAAGLANKEIAAASTFPTTPPNHVAAILGKLGAATRTEAVASASAAASSSFKSRVPSFLSLVRVVCAQLTRHNVSRRSW